MNKDEIEEIKNSEELPEFMTLEEVSKLLRVNIPTLYRYINRQENPLPVMHINKNTPRILRSQFNQWIDNLVEKR